MQPIHSPPNAGQPVNVMGTSMFIRIHGRDTAGTVSAVESHDLPGGGPPPHIHHREDETFQVLEGEYEFIIAGKTVIAQKGATLFAPRGIPHTYRYVGQTPGKLLCLITPAGFEKCFEEVNALTPDQRNDFPLILELTKKYGLEILPPPASAKQNP